MSDQSVLVTVDERQCQVHEKGAHDRYGLNEGSVVACAAVLKRHEGHAKGSGAGVGKHAGLAADSVEGGVHEACSFAVVLCRVACKASVVGQHLRGNRLREQAAAAGVARNKLLKKRGPCCATSQ